MRLAICQLDITWENPQANKESILHLLDSADMSAVDWLVLPEMTLTGFSMDPAKTTIEATDVAFFREVAMKNRLLVTFGGVMDRQNHSISIAPSGETLMDYAKIHLFSYAGEDRAYQPGVDRCHATWAGLRIMPAICYDLRFSDLFWDQAPATDIYVLIANWPASRREHWRTLLRARAIENQAFVIGVNRVGSDHKNSYDGDSLVIDPRGNILLDPGTQAGLHMVDIDPVEVARTRETFPFLNDRSGARR